MAKIIMGKEIGKIVGEVLNHPELYFDDIHDAMHFADRIMEAITEEFGGLANQCDTSLDEKHPLCVAVNIDERVPGDGGIWRHYDKDVKWEQGKETQP